MIYFKNLSPPIHYNLYFCRYPTMRKLFLIFTFLTVFFNRSTAQESVVVYPKNDFRNPLGIQNFLAGNFGELRTNHFHSGIDIKTNQKEGYKVYASADGFVSRISVSPRGYGNAVYIDHPNGYTTVYGHLQKFNPEIEEFVRNYQYSHQSFAVEIYPEKNEIQVKSGDVIALSGNSGSSGGPHLHFEIRDTKTEEPLNPFLFGLDIPDTSKPLINGVYVYPINGTVNGKSYRQTVSNGAVLSASGKIGIGIKTYDKQNGADNNNGTYKISLFADDEPIFVFTADRLNWDDMRGINRLIDYEDKSKNFSWVYQLFQPDGNPLKMFSDVKNHGIIDVKDGKNYKIRIETLDFAGNKNSVSFQIKGQSPPIEKPKNPDDIVFKWNTENHFKKDGVEISMPKGVIYDDLIFKFRKTENGKYEIHDWNVPVHSYYTLSILPDGIPSSQFDKLIFKREYQYKGVWKTDYIPAEYKDGKAVAKVRDFGFFSVAIDDTKPTINPINIKENSTFTGSNGVIRFTIKDSQTKIKGFSAFIDGQWTLSEYDLKSNSLTIDLNREGISNGKHKLELKVWDEKENTTSYTTDFNKN